MTMSESRNITTPAVKAIGALPRAKALKVHGNVYTENGTPDLHACVAGVPYWLEGKRPGKKPEPIQRKRLMEWHQAGAIVGIIYSAAEAVAIVQGDEAMRAEAFRRIES